MDRKTRLFYIMSNSTNDALFDFKFYEWEEKYKDKPFSKQPFGDTWEEYTWGEVDNRQENWLQVCSHLDYEKTLILV